MCDHLDTENRRMGSQSVLVEGIERNESVAFSFMHELRTDLGSSSSRLVEILSVSYASLHKSITILSLICLEQAKKAVPHIFESSSKTAGILVWDPIQLFEMLLIFFISLLRTLLLRPVLVHAWNIAARLSTLPISFTRWSMPEINYSMPFHAIIFTQFGYRCFSCSSTAWPVMYNARFEK